MIKHYIKIAVRNLAKQKGLAFINLAGLSIGLACFILFLLYTINELSFDRFHKNATNIFRVYQWTSAMKGEAARGDSYMPMPMGPAIKQELPDVLQYVRIKEAWGQNFIKAEGKTIREGVVYADPQVMDVFSFKLITGNLNNPLSDPRNVVLTEETAERLFGQTDPVGKRLEIKVDDKFEPFVVAAIAEDLPVNSSIQFKILGSFNFFENSEGGRWAKDNWNRAAFQTYVQLRAGSKLAKDPAKLAAFYKKYYPNEEAELRLKGSWKEKGSPVTYALQPLASMHTETKIFGGAIETVDPKTIWLLLSIAAAVLIIACINFTTLAIGRFAGRAREVGIRKVVGSRKKDLVFQFLMEAFLLTVLSTAVGLLLCKLLLPYFNQLSGRELSFSLRTYPELAWIILPLVMVAGLLAGGYPSLILSGFKPIEVLKRDFKVGGANLFTKSLVTLQFILSVGLIISTLVIMQQLKFMRTKNPGFNKENVIVVDAEGTDGNKVYPLFKEEVRKNGAVTGIASSELGIGEGAGWSLSGFDYNGKHKEVYEYFIDNDYLNVMNIPLLAGRNFDPAMASDTVTSVIINEAMMKDMGWSIDNVIGQQVKGYSETKTPVVIGLVKDFHFRPFSEKVLPQLFHQYASYKPFKFIIRIQQSDPSTVLASLENAWKKVVPDLPFKFSFLDEDIDRFYKSEIRWSRIMGWAGGIAIFLACLGLLGLAALATINRTKEIGIRKVLGASVSNIITLLSKDFLKLVLLAFIIATPVAWYLMKQWLQSFAYRIDISWWVFAATGLFAVLIALITISFQGIKAAIANPVKNLRNE